MLCPTCLAENPDNATECKTCGAPLEPLDGSSPSPQTSSSSLLYLQPGSLLMNGEYEIKSVLGQGGFGITYKGVYRPNGAEVAIKELWPEQAARQGNNVLWSPTITPQQQREQIQSFLLEAYNQHQCQHPNIAQVYYWLEENNTAYIIMQFIAGNSLFGIFKDEGILEEARVKKYFIQVAEALKIIHLKNFQHRDIKPENILIDGNDNAILIDFGASREFIAGQTKKMTQIVTPGYAPLEQYIEKSQRYPATDFYACCASMYELLTGKLPTEAVNRTSYPDPLIAPRQINSNVSELMEKVILMGMKMNIKERFQTADDLIDALNGNLTSPSQKQAQEFVKQGKLNEASRMYARCLKDDPTNKTAAIEYALVSIHINDSQAEMTAKKAIQLNPNDGRGYGVLGLFYCRQGKWTEAVTNLKQAVNLCPDQVWILANYAWALGKTNNWQQAALEIKKALNLDENCSFALGIQAWILFQQQQYKTQQLNAPAVIPCAIKALSSANASLNLKQWLYPYLITALSRVTHPITGGSLNRQIEKCLQENPAHFFVLGYRGWQQVNSGKLLDAVQSFQRASQDPSVQAWILVNTAIAYEYDNKITEAIQTYEICTQKMPQFPFVYYRLGTLLGRSQQWQQAQQKLEEAINLKNDYAQAHHNLGWVLLNQKNSDGVVESVREVISAYKKALSCYKQQNQEDWGNYLEQILQNADISF